MARLWMLSAVGSDRPGIVAQVTEALYRLGCNLEDSAMTRLGGEFAIMLVCSSAAALSQRRVDAALAPLATRMRLVLHAKPLASAGAAPRTAGRPYLLSVYGADRPGIVFRISELLASRRINISDLSTRRTAQSGRGRSSLYLMMLEVELPAGVAVKRLERALRRLAKRLKVEVRLQPADTEIL